MSRCVNRWHGGTIGGHSLSQPFGLPAPSEREPGLAVPFTAPPGNCNVAGDFHRPYGTQKFLHFTIQRGTLPQGGSRGGAGTIQPGACETGRVAGDFHRPYDGSECFTFHHSTGAGSEGDGVFGQLMPGEVGDKLPGGGGGVLVDEAGGEGQVAGDFRRGFALSQLP